MGLGFCVSNEVPGAAAAVVAWAALESREGVAQTDQ